MDEDDKVRRNLVVFCAMVITVFWLDLSVAKLLEKLTGSESASFSLFRLWSLAGVVLAYLSLRHKFPLRQPAAGEVLRWKQDFTSNRMALIGAGVRRAVRHWGHAEHVPAFGWLDSPPRAKVLEFFNRSNLPVLDYFWSENDGSFAVEFGINEAWVGTIRAPFAHTPLPNHGAAGDEVQVGFKVPLLARLRITCSCAVRGALYSRYGINVLAPIALAYVAAICIAYKLGTNLWN